MRTVGYAYPWDYLGDPGAAERAASLGLDGVVLAAAYHAIRGASPLHPTRRVLSIPHSASYVPVRDEVWRDRALAPRAVTWLEDEASFTSASRALADVGLTSEAWIVLNHVDGLAESAGCHALNAFGDRYDYALCPSAEEVRDYGRTLVEEIVRATDTGGIVLEALGPMGFEHHGVHDKTDLAGLSLVQQRLLSLCFCAHCRHGYVEHEIEPDELAARVRHGVTTEATSVDDALGVDLAVAVSHCRAAVVTRYLGEIVGALHALAPGTRVTLHASALTWTTGSFCEVGSTTSLDDVTTVANCWDASTAESEVRALRNLDGPAGRVGAYLRLDGADRDADATIAALRSAGADELHLYHLGLVGLRGLDEARELARVAHSSRD